jgi:hypothetical protein
VKITVILLLAAVIFGFSVLAKLNHDLAEVKTEHASTLVAIQLEREKQRSVTDEQLKQLRSETTRLDTELQLTKVNLNEKITSLEELKKEYVQLSLHMKTDEEHRKIKGSIFISEEGHAQRLSGVVVYLYTHKEWDALREMADTTAAIIISNVGKSDDSSKTVAAATKALVWQNFVSDTPAVAVPLASTESDANGDFQFTVKEVDGDYVLFASYEISPRFEASHFTEGGILAWLISSKDISDPSNLQLSNRTALIRGTFPANYDYSVKMAASEGKIEFLKKMSEEKLKGLHDFMSASSK